MSLSRAAAARRVASRAARSMATQARVTVYVDGSFTLPEGVPALAADGSNWSIRRKTLVVTQPDGSALEIAGAVSVFHVGGAAAAPVVKAAPAACSVCKAASVPLDDCECGGRFCEDCAHGGVCVVCADNAEEVDDSIAGCKKLHRCVAEGCYERGSSCEGFWVDKEDDWWCDDHYAGLQGRYRGALQPRDRCDRRLRGRGGRNPLPPCEADA